MSMLVRNSHAEFELVQTKHFYTCNIMSNTGRQTKQSCRLCKKPCYTSTILWNRKFREKLQDIICKWVELSPFTKNNNICWKCQANVEDFYAFKTKSRSVLNGANAAAQATPDSSNDLTSGFELQTILDCCVDEVSLPSETLQHMGIQSKNDFPSRKKKLKKNTETCEKKEKRFKRPARRKTEEEKAMSTTEFRKHYYRLYKDRYKVICDLCGKCIHQERMEGHMNRHNGVQPYSCEHCTLQFHCKFNWRQHVHRNHVQNDEVTCEICDKVLVSKIAHKQHVRTVHKEKKLQCTVCGLRAHRQFTLDRHMDIHNQRRDFKCTHCGKSFYRQYVLDIHLRTHSGETPYTCHVCQIGFVHRRIYVMHMKKLHPEEKMMRLDGTKAMKEALMRKAI